MSIETLKEQARNHEQREEWQKALDLYLLAVQESDDADQPDISLYNRVGDLEARLGTMEAAAEHYMRAVDLYVEAELPNNAIAVCKKIIRNVPERADVHLRMGQIRAGQGFLTDARHSFLVYAELQQQGGDLEEAFRALIEFADLAPDDTEVRLALASQLHAHERTDEAVEQLVQARSVLILAGRGEEAGEVEARVSELAPDYGLPTESEIRASATPAAPAVADDGFALEDISTTAGFAEDEEEVGPVGSMEGFETTHLAEELTVPGADLLAADDSDEQEESDEEVTVEVAATLEDSDSGELTDQLEGLPDLEAAFAEDESGDESSEEPALEVEAFDAGEAGEEPSIIIEHDFGDAVHVDIPAFEAGDDDSSPSDVGLAFSDAIQNGADPMDALEDLAAGFEGAAFSDDEAEDSEEDDLVLETPAFDDLAAFGSEEADEPAFSSKSDDEPAFTDDIGGLDLGTDVDFGFGDQDPLSAESSEDPAEEDTAVEGLAEDEMADLPLMSFDDESGLEAEETFDDAGADEDGVSPDSLADLQLDAPAFTSDIVNPFEAPATAEAGDRQGIDDTGLLVAATPDSPSDLMEAGIAALHAGNGEEGVPLLEQAYQGFADVGDFDAAAQAVRELAQHAPNEVEYRQRMVEVAFQLSDDDVLVQAYLDLARCLGENGETDQAASVYQQVLNLDPQNDEASSAVTKAGGEAPAAQVSSSEVSSSEDYVDLGALIFDEDEEEKTTRWFVEMEAPSGDDEADFAKMLSQFKSKVAEHIEADDVRAHYDLGTAYREMGLVDEAIAEFQQALRASGNHLPTYEILGQCFMEKGQYEVAIRSMGRAMDAEYEVEDELLGIYYYLGVAHEELGNVETASEFYERIFSLDINFRDVTERLRALR